MTSFVLALGGRHPWVDGGGNPAPPRELDGLLRGGALTGLAVLWVLFGLIGHDPWKPDEAHYFGVVLELLHDGDWVVPMLAGEPWVEKPPLFYLVAGALAAAGQHVLSLHDAARLATGVFVGIAVLFVGLTGRELGGRGFGSAAVLLMLGCIGTIARMHQLITDVALLAGIAVGTYGLALARRSAWIGGSFLGVGAACAFLSKGLLGPGWLGLTAGLLPLFAPWRRRGYVSTLAIASIFVAVPAAIWMRALYARSPALFAEWLINNNIGRFMGSVRLGVHNPPGFYAVTLLWYAIPALPLIAFAIARTLGRSGADPSTRGNVALPLLLGAVMLSVLALASESRDLYLLPVVVPLSLAGAWSLPRLPPAFARVWSATSRVVFGTLAIALWGGWIALMTGFPAGVHAALASYQPGYVPHVQMLRLLLAGAATVVGSVFLLRRASTAGAALTQWTVGATLCWAVVSTLWSPFIDAGKSYRAMIHSLAHELPTTGCVASLHLGEPQRALLEYFAGVTTKRLEVEPGASCMWLLVQGWRATGAAPSEGQWILVWEGARAGDATELYRLYRRDVSADHRIVRYPR